jgi:hypothetical protein
MRDLAFLFELNFSPRDVWIFPGSQWHVLTCVFIFGGSYFEKRWFLRCVAMAECSRVSLHALGSLCEGSSVFYFIARLLWRFWFGRLVDPKHSVSMQYLFHQW